MTNLPQTTHQEFRPGRTAVAVLALLVLSTVAVPSFAGSAKEIARGLRVNQQALQDFSWKSRAESTLGGKKKTVQHFDVRYDMDGSLLKTPEATTPSKRKTAPSPDLQALVDAYTHLTPVALKAMFGKATISPGEGVDSGLVRVQAEGVRSLGDRVAIWVDRESKRPQRYEIETTLEGREIRIEARFAQLDQGPSYPASTTVHTRIKAKPLVFSIENFGFTLEER